MIGKLNKKYPAPRFGQCRRIILDAIQNGATARDIADAAGVHESVVSRIKNSLDGEGVQVAPITMARIMAGAVGELDYIQHEAAHLDWCERPYDETVERLADTLAHRGLDASAIAPIVAAIYEPELREHQ